MRSRRVSSRTVVVPVDSSLIDDMLRNQVVGDGRWERGEGRGRD